MSFGDVGKAKVTFEVNEQDIDRAFAKLDAQLATQSKLLQGINKQLSDSNKSVSQTQDDLSRKIDKTAASLKQMKNAGTIDSSSAEKFQAVLDKVDQSAKDLDKRDIRVLVELTGDVQEQLADIQAKADKLDGDDIRLSTSLDDTKALASLDRLEAQVNHLDGQKINIDVDVDPDKLNQADRSLKSIGSDVSSLQQMEARGSLFRVLFALLPVIVTGAVQLGGALTAMVAPLTSVIGEVVNLGGVFGRATPLAVSFGAGIAGVASAIAPTAVVLKQIITPVQQAAQALAAAQKIQSGPAQATALRQAGLQYGALTKTQKEFVPIQLQANKQMQAFQTLLAKPALGTYKNLLVALFASLKNLKPELLDNADAVEKFSHNFTTFVGTNQTQGFLKQITQLGGYIINTLGGPALKALGAVRDIVSASIPDSERLTSAIASVLDNFSKTVEAASKSGKLSDYFNEAWTYASKLAAAAGNVLDAFERIFDATHQSSKSTADDILNLSKRFDDFIKTVQGNGSLDKFFKTARTDFNDMLNLFYQLGRVIAGVLNAAEPAGDKLDNTLGKFLENLADNINSVTGQDKLRKFFANTIPAAEQFGNDLVSILQALFKLNQDFGGGNFLTGVLNALDDVVQGFNALPKPLQTVITSMGALQAAGSLIGINFFGVLFNGFKTLTGLWDPAVRGANRLRDAIKGESDIAKEAQDTNTKLGGVKNDAADAFEGERVAATEAEKAVANESDTAAASQGVLFDKSVGKAKAAEDTAGGAGAAAPVVSSAASDTEKAADDTKDLASAESEAANEGGALSKALSAIGLGSIAKLFSKAAGAAGEESGGFADALIAGSKALGIIGLAIGAVIGFVEDLSSNFAGVGTVFKGIIDIYKDLGKQFVQMVNELSGGHADEIFSALGDAAKFAADHIGTVISITTKLLGVLGAITAIFIISPFVAIAAAVDGVIRVINLLIPLLEKLPGIFSSAFTTSENAVKSAFTTVINILSAIPGQISSIFSPIPDQVAAFFKQIPGQLLNLIAPLPGQMWAIIQKIPYYFGELVGLILKSMVLLPIDLLVLFTQAIADAIKGIISGGKAAGSAAASLVKTIVGEIKALPGQLLNLAKTAGSDIGRGISNGASAAAKAALSVAKAVVNAIANLPGELLNLAKKAISNIVGFFTGTGTTQGAKASSQVRAAAVAGLINLPADLANIAVKAIASFIKAVASSIGAVAKAFANVGKDIVSVIDQIPSKAYNAAKNIGAQFAKGVLDGIGNLGTQVLNKLKSIPGVGTAIKIGGDVVGGISSAANSVFRSAGGMIPNPYGGVRGDSVNARLEPGEYVIKRTKVQQIGQAFFDRLNYGNRMPGPQGTGAYASGGIVSGTTGLSTATQVGSVVSGGVQDLFNNVGSLSSSLTQILNTLLSTEKSVMKSFADDVKAQTQKAKEAATQNAQKMEEQVSQSEQKSIEQTDQHYQKMQQQTTQHFENMRQAITQKSQKAQAAATAASSATQIGVNTDLSKMEKGADFSFDSYEKSVKSHSDDAQKAGSKSVAKLQSDFGDAMNNTATVTQKGMQKVYDDVNAVLKAFGVKALPALKLDSSAAGGGPANTSTGNNPRGTAIGKAKGGRIGNLMRTLAEGGRMFGYGLMDSIPALLAPGEVVLNRHQEAYLESAAGMPGLVQHTVDAITTPHNAVFARGGRALRRFTSGGKASTPELGGVADVGIDTGGDASPADKKLEESMRAKWGIPDDVPLNSKILPDESSPRQSKTTATAGDKAKAVSAMASSKLARGGRVFKRFASGGRATADSLIQAMVNEANAIAGRAFNYEWGGGHTSIGVPSHGTGHGSGSGVGFDCSGAVSAVLHAAGLLNAPEVAAQFMSYGQPGPGDVTINASPGHVFMDILGRGFGTSDSNKGGGAGWLPYTSLPGFVKRHVPLPGKLTAANTKTLTSELGGSGVWEGGGVTAPTIKAPGVSGGGALADAVKGALAKAASAANKKVQSAAASSSAGVGGSATAPAGTPAQARKWTEQAMRLAGVAGSAWENMLLRQEYRESTYNPGAINRTDINAQEGNPSEGIMQITGTNFRQYEVPGHGNILNPVDNIAAAIKYIIGDSRWGGGNAAVGLQKMIANGGNAYAKGGRVARAIASPMAAPIARALGNIRSKRAAVPSALMAAPSAVRKATGGRIGSTPPRSLIPPRRFASGTSGAGASSSSSSTPTTTKGVSQAEAKAQSGITASEKAAVAQEQKEAQQEIQAIKQTLLSQLSGLGAAAAKLIKDQSIQIAQTYSKSLKTMENGLSSLIGKTDDLTKKSVDNIAKVLAQAETIRKLATAPLAKDDPNTKINENAASKKIQDAAKKAESTVKQTLQDTANAIASGGQAVFDQFNQFLQAGQQLLQSKFQPQQEAESSLSDQTLLQSDDPAQFNKYQKAISGATQTLNIFGEKIKEGAKDIQEYTTDQQFNLQTVKVAAANIKDLGNRFDALNVFVKQADKAQLGGLVSQLDSVQKKMKTLQSDGKSSSDTFKDLQNQADKLSTKIANLNKNISGTAKENLKQGVLTATQAGITALQNYFDEAKQQLDTNLSNQMTALENQRTGALNAAETAYDKQSQPSEYLDTGTQQQLDSATETYTKISNAASEAYTKITDTANESYQSQVEGLEAVYTASKQTEGDIENLFTGLQKAGQDQYATLTQAASVSYSKQYAAAQDSYNKQMSAAEAAYQQGKISYADLAQIQTNATQQLQQQEEDALQTYYSNLEDAATAAYNASQKALQDKYDDETSAADAAYQAQEDAYNNMQTDMTRTATREQEKRDQLTTERSIGQLSSQEFFTQDDLNQLQSLQEQLAESVQSAAQQEQSWKADDDLAAITKAYNDAKDARDKQFALDQQDLQDQYNKQIAAIGENEQTAMDALTSSFQDQNDAISRQQTATESQMATDYQNNVNTINAEYDAAETQAQQDYAAALTTLTNQTTQQMNNLINQAAKALGVGPGKIWEFLLSGADQAQATGKAQGFNTGASISQGVADSAGLFTQAGVALMSAFASGILQGQGGAKQVLRGALADMATLLPHSDAEEGPFSTLTASGASVWPTFAEGMKQGLKNLDIPAMNIPDVAAPNVKLPGLQAISDLTNGSSIDTNQKVDMNHNFKISVEATGLSPAEKQQLIKETSRQIARESNVNALTATANARAF